MCTEKKVLILNFPSSVCMGKFSLANRVWIQQFWLSCKGEVTPNIIMEQENAALVDCSSFWSFFSPSFFSLFHSPLSSPHGRAQPCQNWGLAGQGDGCCVFKVNRSWLLRVHGGVTACARLLHVLKLDLTPCLLWRWNPWQVIILLSHIISDSLSTSLPAKSQLLGREKMGKKELRKPRRSETPQWQTEAIPGVLLRFHCKTGSAGVLKHCSLDQCKIRKM